MRDMRSPLFLFLVFGLSILAMTSVDAQDADGEDYCCFTGDSCYGPYEDYGDTYQEMGYDDKSAVQDFCADEGGQFFDEACGQVTQCVQGCCVFRDGDDWMQNYPVGEAACMDRADDAAFNLNVDSQVACESYFQDEEFPIYLNIIDSDGEEVSVDSDSYIQDISSEEQCNLESVAGGDDYNYAVDCDGNDKVGFGSYQVFATSEEDSLVHQGDTTIYASGEETFDIVMRSDKPVSTITIEGQIFEYAEEDDSLVETDTHVADATITVSGLNIQTSSGSDGRFVLEDVPVDKDASDEYYVRTLTINAPGFHPWAENVEVNENDRDMGDIYLLESDDTSGGHICCPNIIGCADDAEGSASCFAGQGQYGQLCEGETPQDACDVAAPFCCPSEFLCDPDDRSDAGGCAGQGCNVACDATVQCLDSGESSTSVDDVCRCGSEYVDDGYCCDSTHRDEPCEDYGTEISGLVLGNGRFDDQFVPKSGASVFFRESDGTTHWADTDSDGEFTIQLPDEEFRSNVVLTGYNTPINSRRLNVDKEDGDFTFSILDSPYVADDDEYDDLDLVVDAINLSENGTTDPFEIPDFLDPDGDGENTEFNQIFTMDYSIDECDLNDASTRRIDEIEAVSVPGERAALVKWELADCLELRHFRVERKATLYTADAEGPVYADDVEWVEDTDASDDRFFEIAQVPSSRDFYQDEDVRWSEHVDSYENVPAIANSGDGGIITTNDHDMKKWVYEYRITPMFAGLQGETTEVEMEMGDSVCENKGLDEMCAYDSLRPSTEGGEKRIGDVITDESAFRFAELRSLRAQRVQCNSDNRIELIDNCYTNDDEDYTIIKDDERIYAGSSCAGPTPGGNTQCRKRHICQGDYFPDDRGAFGLLEPLLHQTNMDNLCLGPEISDTGKYKYSCSLQPDTTTSDKCMYCEEINDCTAYTSQQSCEIDNCMASSSGCEWIDTAMSGAGEGVCIPQEDDGNNYCELATRDNLPFQSNVGWSDEFCKELGNCFASISKGCKDCDEINECGNYETQQECIGVDLQNISIDYPIKEHYFDEDGNEQEVDGQTWDDVEIDCALPEDNKFIDPNYNFSNDGCGLGTCRWTEDNECIRDANSNFARDPYGMINPDVNALPELVLLTDTGLIFSRQDGRRDLEFKSTSPVFRGVRSGSSAPGDSESMNFSANEFGFRYCIDKDDNCCPHLPGDGQSVVDMIGGGGDELTISGIADHDKVDGDGIYYIRYLAQDEDLNVAPLESVEVLVDVTDPSMTIDFTESETGNPDDDQINLRFDVESVGDNPDPGVDEEAISCEMNLANIIGDSSEDGTHHEEDQFTFFHQAEYVVEPGLYEFEAECKDQAGNSHTESITVRADGQDNLAVVQPGDGGAVADETTIPFEIHTPETPSQCLVSWPAQPGSEEKQVIDLEANEDGTVHTPSPEIQLSDLPGEGPVFDESLGNGVEVACDEDQKVCTAGSNEGEACDSDADCDAGSCEKNDISHPITFAIDGVPPETTLHPEGYDSSERWNDISERRRDDYAEIQNHDYVRDGSYYYNNNVSVDFSCEGVAPDDDFNIKADCAQEQRTRYCIQTQPSDGDRPNYDSEIFCGSNDPGWTWLDEGDVAEISMSTSFSICYYSVDDVGNEEDTRCTLFYINEDDPELDLAIDTDYTYGDSFITGEENNMFSGNVSSDMIEHYDLNYVDAHGSDSHLLVMEEGDILASPDHYESRSEDGKIQFSGSLPSFTTQNTLSENTLMLSAEDRYGNTASTRIFLYYDRQPPLLRNYEINEESMAKEVDYDSELRFKFYIDDVFWTRDIEDVYVNVYAYDASPFAPNYEMGEMEPEFTGVVSPDSDNTRQNFSEDVADYVNELFNYGTSLEPDAERDRLDDISEWKRYEFTIDPEFDHSTMLSEMGIGEYIFEIGAQDPMGQEVKEHILFNVTNPVEPEINLHEPPVYVDPDDGADERRRVSNNINQEFHVTTEQPSDCFFDLGTRPSEDNPMFSDDTRTEHRYILDDFRPFDSVTLPVTITCANLGLDLLSEQYSLRFDRRPLRLDMESNRGELVSPEVNRNHIREYRLDYSQRMFQGLNPAVTVEDENTDRELQCSYECVSPNSRCKNVGQDFPLTGRLSSPSFNPNIGEEFGDYLYTITCNDQAGNMARTRDLALTVRDRGAPQTLYILDDSFYPEDGTEIYDKVVDFGISTTMLTSCDIVFTQGGHESIEMSDQASLSHEVSVNMSNHTGQSRGSYDYKYSCTLSTDPGEVVETDTMTFTMMPEFDAISEDMFTQRSKNSMQLPVFRLDDFPDDIEFIEYSLEEDADFDDSASLPNSGSLVLPDIGPNQTVFVRGVYDTGHKTGIINITSDPETIEPREADLEVVRNGLNGLEISPLVDSESERQIYPMTEDDIDISIRLDQDTRIDSIDAMLNGETVSASRSEDSAVVTRSLVTIMNEGNHDLYMLMTDDSEDISYLHFPIAKNTEPPEIEDISPRFLKNDRKLTVELSRSAECSVVYPVKDDDVQQTLRSDESALQHTFVLDDIEMSGSRHEVTQVSVSCNDMQDNLVTEEHLLQLDNIRPEVIDIFSDNSIHNESYGGADYAFTAVRDEDVHINVNTNEYTRCTYTDGDGEEHKFNDYFLPNLYPHASLDVEDGEDNVYTISCENEAGLMSDDYTVAAYKNTDAPLHIHDAYPSDVVGERFPEVEVYTFREPDRCFVDVHEDDESANIFFRIASGLFTSSTDMESELIGHRYRHTADISTSSQQMRRGLQEGNIYRATISCQYAGDSTSKDISFMYSSDADPRPQIYIE